MHVTLLQSVTIYGVHQTLLHLAATEGICMKMAGIFPD